MRRPYLRGFLLLAASLVAGLALVGAAAAHHAPDQLPRLSLQLCLLLLAHGPDPGAVLCPDVGPLPVPVRNRIVVNRTPAVGQLEQLVQEFESFRERRRR